MKLLPFGLAHAFLMAPAGTSQGSGSTGDDFDDAADDALVAEGEEELDTSEDGDPEAESDPDEDLEAQSDEDQDEEEEEGEEEDEEVDGKKEEDSESGFKFKDPKTGNFDWKRINKVLGDDTLEKAIREQNQTITKYSQEIKSLKESTPAPEVLKEATNKAGFFDHLMANDPGVRREVLRVLNNGPQQGQQGQNLAGGALPEGIDPNDPLAPVVMQLAQTVQLLQSRTQEEDRQRQSRELEDRFVNGLREARTRFKELLGKDPSEEQIAAIANEMRDSGDLRGARFVADLFHKEIDENRRLQILNERKEKRAKLTKTGLGRKSSLKNVGKSREQEQDDLWSEHMG